MEIPTHKTYCKRFSATKMVLLMIILIGISSISTVSAADWDNVLNKEDKEVQEYPTLYIDNLFGIGKRLAEINIIKNTGECIINCYTIGNITLYEADTIFDEIEFINKSNHIKHKDYDIYLEVENRINVTVKDYDKVCTNQSFGNETREVCTYKDAGEHTEEVITYSWKKYKGEELEPGYYKWKFESKRDEIKLGDSIDWSFGMMGITPKQVREYYVWWNSNWLKRREIRLEGGVATLTNFTIFLNITHDSDMQADFDDLRFIDGACNGSQTDELSFEIDYKANSNYAAVWVKMPSLSTGLNNFICMYYHNDGASESQVPADTWDDGYVFVYHFSNGSGFDSTGNFNAASIVGSTADADVEGFGIAQVFDGTNDYWVITTGSNFPRFAGPMLVEIVQRDVTTTDYAPFLAKSGGPPKQFYMAKEGATIGVYTETASTNYGTNAGTGVAGIDYGNPGDYLAVLYNASTDALYYNKSKVQFDAKINGVSHINVADFQIMRDGVGNFAVGTIDEIRLSNVTRSQAWVNRSIDNLNFSFFNISEEEALASLNSALFTPTAGQNFTFEIVNFSCNGTTDTSIDGVVNLSLILDGELNLTVFNASANQNLSIEVSYNLTDDNYNYTCEANSPGLSQTAAIRFFIVHIVPASIIINTPSGDLGANKGENITLSWNVAEVGEDLATHIKNCSYLYNGILTNLTTNECISVNETSFIYVNGVNTLEFFVTEEFNFITSNTTAWSFTFAETNITFESTVTETSTQNFTYNFSTTLDILSINAVLDYNGTNFTSTASCTGGNCTAFNQIDIPLVLNDESQLVNFSWFVDVFNDTDTFNITSSPRTQNVTRIHLEECAGAFTQETLNFTAADEEDLDRVNPMLFNGFFEFWTGSGNIRRNNSFSLNSTAEVVLCLTPVDDSFFTDADIEYDEGEGSTNTYGVRSYQFQNEVIRNDSRNITLFLLNSSSSTSFIIKVRDDNLLPLPNHVVITERFYPGTGQFEAVQIGITGPSGETVGFFQTETVDYRFIVMFQGETLLTTEKEKIVGKTTPFTITLTIGENLGAPWQGFEDLEGLATNLTFNRTTEEVVFTWIDTSTNFSEAILIVTLLNQSGPANESLCNLNSSGASGSLICEINNNGTYTATSYIRRESTTTIVGQIIFSLQRLSDILGLYGVFLGWLVILLLSFTFKFNEIAGVWIVFIGMIVINFVGLINFGGVWLTAFGVIAIITTAILKQ